MKRIVFTFRMVVILLSMMPLAVSAVTVEVKTAGTLEMDNYKITFYSSDKNSKEVEMVSNMMGGNNYNIIYYSNNLAGAFANSRMP